MAKRALNTKLPEKADEPGNEPADNVADTTTMTTADGQGPEPGLAPQTSSEPNPTDPNNPVPEVLDEPQNAQPGEEPVTTAENTPEAPPAPLPFRTLVSDNGDLDDAALAALGFRPDQTPALFVPPGETLVPSSPLVERVSPTVAAAQSAISERTRAEQEAGREAVARKQAEYERNQRITSEDAARRLREGTADVGDLGYSAPR